MNSRLETIQACILNLDGVTKTVVMEVINPNIQEVQIVAHVEARYHITKFDILHHCQHNLESGMIPGKIKLWDYIPITKWGKPDLDFMRQSCFPTKDNKEPVTAHFSSY